MKITGVLHMHSTHSYDGKVSLTELKQLLVAEGISVACMSEHTDTLTEEAADAFVAECHALSDDSFLFIPGFEVPYQDAHILMFGCEEFLGRTANAQQLRAWREVAALVVLAHPVRNHFRLDEVMRDVVDGIEVWNQQYDGKRVPRVRSYELLTTLRKERARLIATGGLDLHRPEHLTFPRITLEVPSLRMDTVLTHIQSGAFDIVGRQVCVPARMDWAGIDQVSTVVQSRLSIIIIKLGKLLNKTLAAYGLALPKGLVRSIRSRV